MTTAKLYEKFKSGEVSKAHFLAEVRKDSNLPWITNMTSFEDSVKILKNKSVISENQSPTTKTESDSDLIEESYTQALMQHGQGSQDYPGMEYRSAGIKGGPKDPVLSDILSHYQVRDNYEEAIELAAAENGMEVEELMAKYPADTIESELHMYSDMADVKEELNEVDNNIQMVPEVDLVNPYFLKRGMHVELSKIKQLTDDSYVIAMNKAAKKLHSNPHAYDDVMLFNAKEIEKRDKKLEMEPAKEAALVDKDNEMKVAKGFEAKKNTSSPKTENKKGKPKGVKEMKGSKKKPKGVKDVMKSETKETVLHEIANFLKKKDNINENGPVVGLVPQERSDYRRDETVVTPKGPAIVLSRQGSVVEVEMEDGSTKHFTLNVLDAAKEKQQQSKSDSGKAERDKMWQDWDKRGEKTFGGMTADPKSSTQDLLKKIKGLLEKMKMKKEAVDVIKAKTAQGADEVLDTVPAGQGNKAIQDLKKKISQKGGSVTSLKATTVK